MEEATLTERLDERGLLTAARGPGCYCLTLNVPENFAREWDAEFDVRPAGLVDRVESAHALLYVGAASNVYRRLCEHVNAEKRRASLLRVAPPADVVDVTACENPFEREYGYALGFAESATVWCDGELIG